MTGKCAARPLERYAQIGNAVPVRLGTVAGEVIAEQLDVLSKHKWKPLPHKPESFRIIYVQSHVRTRQWFKDGETLVWEDGNRNGDAVLLTSENQTQDHAAILMAKKKLPKRLAKRANERTRSQTHGEEGWTQSVV